MKDTIIIDGNFCHSPSLAGLPSPDRGMKICSHCGKMFERNEQWILTTLFCSFLCNVAWSVENKEDCKRARCDTDINGLPPTPARWQRQFGWKYIKSQTILELVRKGKIHAD